MSDETTTPEVVEEAPAAPAPAAPVEAPAAPAEKHDNLYATFDEE